MPFLPAGRTPCRPRCRLAALSPWFTAHHHLPGAFGAVALASLALSVVAKVQPVFIPGSSQGFPYRVTDGWYRRTL